MWNRKHIEFIYYDEVPWRPLHIYGLPEGLQIRRLSEDPDDGACSAILRVPAGWRCDVPFVSSAPEQLFVLKGDLTKSYQRYTEQCYAFRPAGAPHGPMWSETGCEAIVMWDRKFEVYLNDKGNRQNMIPLIDTVDMHWERNVSEGPAAGIKVKRLREVPDTGEMTALIGIMPNWYERRQQHHSCVEESFKIYGDMNLNTDLGDDMWMGENSYFYRPPFIKHGPLYTRKGTMSLVRVSSTLINRYMQLEDDPAYWEYLQNQAATNRERVEELVMARNQ